MTDAVVKIQGLSFSYSAVPVLEDVDLTVRAGECASIVGPNGGGKTTLLKLMLGLIRPDRGSVRVFGSDPRRASSRIGYMPQHARYDSAFPASVLDVVLMGRLGIAASMGFYTRKDRLAAEEALEEIGLRDRAGEQFSRISGGQRQRALLARALVGDPKLLLLDEPTANLDYVIEGRFYDLMRRLGERMTILIVSHDVGFVSKLVRRVICVSRKVVEHPIAEICDEAMTELYGDEMKRIRHEICKSPGGGGS